MRYKVKPPPKPRFKAFLFVDGELHELKSLTYYMGTATRTKTKTESTRKLPLTSRTIQHCIELLHEALRKENLRHKKAIDSDSD